MIPGLTKQIAVGMLEVLQVAFACDASTAVGSWTDDGGYTRTVTVQGVWSPNPTTYPQIVVQARLARQRGAAGHLMRVAPIAKGSIPVLIYGGILTDVRIRTTVRTASEDEREQLSDLVFQTIWAGANTYGVPFWKMLKNRGISITDQLDDATSQINQDADPAHGPQVFENVLTTAARVFYSSSTTPLGLQTITLNPVTLGVPPFTVQTAS